MAVKCSLHLISVLYICISTYEYMNIYIFTHFLKVYYLCKLDKTTTTTNLNLQVSDMTEKKQMSSILRVKIASQLLIYIY